MNVHAVLSKTADFHGRRARGIGGSDAPIIMAGDEAKLYALWEIKRGVREPDDLSDVLAVQMGTFTEPLNLYWFAKKTGLAISREGEAVTSAEHPFMACTLDGFVAAENAVVQCKHCSGREPFEIVLERYTPQLVHEMIVTGAGKSYLSAFLGSGDWRCETVTLDPFYAAALIEREADFWDCVKSGRPPCAGPAVAVPAGECSRIVDMSGSNSWTVNAALWRDTKEAASINAGALKELKSLVESDVKRAHGHGVEINRDRAGSLRIKEAKP